MPQGLTSCGSFLLPLNVPGYIRKMGKLLGSKGAASELLSGKRKEPSKAQIAKLCARFKVNPAVFLLRAKTPADAA